MNDFFQALAMFILACFAFALFFGLPVMWLWNYSLVGVIDGVHPINFPQALGITVLIGLLTYKPTHKHSNED
jgi:hypothetical protein